MAKRPNKSIADLVGKKTKKPSLDEINEIAEQIHTEKKRVEEPAPKKVKTSDSRNIADRTKRISLNAPLDLYLEIQREATLQGKPMMQYILEVVKEDIDARQ